MNDSCILPKPGRYTVTELRHLIQTGKIYDLESVLPGLDNTKAMSLRFAYEELATLEEMEPEDRRRLGELRLQSVDDVGRRLAERLVQVAQDATFAAALGGESVARVLLLEAEVKRQAQALADQAIETTLIRDLLDRLHGRENVEALVEEIESKEKTYA